MIEVELGRLVPTDWKHVEKYPIRELMSETVSSVERTLKLPYQLRDHYNQQSEGACVGFASSWMMSILNRRYYNAKWLWSKAKEVDEWSYTNPGDNNGTSVRAAMDILRTLGHVRIFRNKNYGPAIKDGILENRWATSVDQVRTTLARGTPVVIGVNWYQNFDHPIKKGRNHWIGLNNLGNVRGGHAVTIYRASDKLQAVGIVNSWGKNYPLVLMPYSVLERLLKEDGEATMITDRV